MMTEDVTDSRLNEVWSWSDKIRPPAKMTATESELLARLPDSTDIGNWHMALQYSPVIRRLCLYHRERIALVKLLKRGKLRIVREYCSGRELLVKVSDAR